MEGNPNLFALIPVLDLKSGCAVQAIGGLREQYRSFTQSPDALLKTLIDQVGGTMAYCADLDAIEGGAIQTPWVARLSDCVDQLWLDAGFRSLESAMAFHQRYPKVTPVLGTESLATLESLANVPVVLSLDLGPEGRRGDQHWWERSDLWPDRVIGMSLNEVGRGAGPNLSMMEALRTQAPRSQLYAAGGVRDRRDVVELAKRGIHGALVATALHTGALP